MLRVILWAAVLSPSLFLAVHAGQAGADENLPQKIDFVRDVQPIFRKHCYSCHGVEEQQAGLRLDIRKRALDGGDSGAVIEPGSSAKSRLIAVVKGADEDTGVMPPEGEGAPLTRTQIALLTKWIDQGAAWPASADNAQQTDHWSFQKLTCPAPPEVESAEIRNAIDAFVQQKLKAKGLEPAPAADRPTLIRRLYLDVLGLPPSPAEVQAFVADKRIGAYELLVEQVLQSRHYGERWGRHWLDLARYADTDGYEKDRPRPFAWRYRQWVIDAINRDMPFDQFSIKQLAGDMLPGATASDRIATGFHRNTLHNTEGGVDREEDRVKKTVDRINTTGAIWMGLTVGCAQCHSHKYDPLTQREYYSLYSMLNNMDEQDITAPTAEEVAGLAKRMEAYETELERLENKLKAYDRDELPSALKSWRRDVEKQQDAWEIVTPTDFKTSDKTKLTLLADQTILAEGGKTSSAVYELKYSDKFLRGITAIRLEVLPHPSLPMGGPGFSSGGNFVLTDFKATHQYVPELDRRRYSLQREDERAKRRVLEGAIEPPEPPYTLPLPDLKLEFTSAKATFSQKGWEVQKAINADMHDGWAIAPRTGMRQVAIFKFAKPVRSDRLRRITLKLSHNYKGESHNLGRFRVSFSNRNGELPFGQPARVMKLLSTGSDAIVTPYFRTIDPKRLKLVDAINKHKYNKPGAKASKARAVVERSAPRQAYVHLRGDFLSKGDDVEPGGPAFLPELPSRGAKPDRLDLARWLFAAENPLTARVTVNRIWQRYFGRGLVRTTDDFGLQGEKPSHPQLLDWLACQLRDHGWSLKHIHRLILNSATYRQSSIVRPELSEIDPLNTLVARQPRRRVEAEIIRDLALASSGLLSRKVGGPSVRPRQPAGYSSLTYAGSAKWTTSKGEDAYRRGLYTFFQRTSPYPMLMTFDSPDATVCIAQRARSNTPLQALTLWNDPVFFEAAQALGRRILVETPAKDETAGNLDRRRLEYAFMLTLARKPDEVETSTLLKTLNRQREISKENPTAATALCGTGPLPGGATQEEVSAWIVVARVLLNLDEFITRE